MRATLDKFLCNILDCELSNPVILNSTSRIGLIAAENDDEFLFKCFVDSSALAELKNKDSSKMLLLGSTGAGKTAIIRKIEAESDRASLIEVREMALNYIGNSNVINFMISLGVDLDIFFQALWKHVILLEFIRLKYNVNDENKSIIVFQRIKEAFANDHKKSKGLEYLQKWENKFWVSMEENVIEITQNLEKKVTAKIGAHLDKFIASAGYIRGLSTEKKTNLRRRIQEFSDPVLLSDLAQAINIQSGHAISNELHFILIDQLDENWISPSIKYPMIRALIESLKSLRRINDLKTVVSLRSDLLEKVILETKSAGFQSEKYEDYIVRLKWDNSKLKTLVNKRINFLYKRQYSKENITFEDIFNEKVNNSSKPFNTILDRTLYRPRDVINFVNMCFEAAEGATFVSRKKFAVAEKGYSANRLQAMGEEWENVISNADTILKLLKGKKHILKISDFCNDDILENLVQHYPDSIIGQSDSLWELVNNAMDNDKLYTYDMKLQLASTLISKLHLMGAVGVKYDTNLPYQFFFVSQKYLATTQLHENAKVKIHPMLHSALGIIH